MFGFGITMEEPITFSQVPWMVNSFYHLLSIVKAKEYYVGDGVQIIKKKDSK
jgi:hypothetical protein